jgi:hypothetical protein
VVQENSRVFKHFVSQIRESTREVVIDPSALEWGGWSQGQWLEFWCDVISKYVRTVVLTPDWQFFAPGSAQIPADMVGTAGFPEFEPHFEGLAGRFWVRLVTAHVRIAASIFTCLEE